MASSSSNSGVPPGFRFHPTDEELLLYYLKKKVSLEKFDLDVIRDVDLNKLEPWDLQERCRIGSTPQNEWYFFSHKDRKYPTGSRTNRATNAGFWKATGRDKCIRTSYKKIGMRKTLVFYRGRAPHGQKTDWIMHEYRLEDSDDDPQALNSEDGWVVCRVFKKKTFFKINEGRGGHGDQESGVHGGSEQGHEPQARALSLGDVQYMHHHPHHQLGLQHHHHQYTHHSSAANVEYWQMPPVAHGYSQAHDLRHNHRPAGGYDFSVLPNDSDGGGMDQVVGGCEPIQQQVVGLGGGREQGGGEWVVLDSMEGRFGGGASAAEVQQMNQMSGQRGGEMDLWGYGK